jgi:hypothetical protein
MLEMVEARRKADKTDQHHDLFSGLLDAAEEESDNIVALNDQELLGKCQMIHVSHIPKASLIHYPREHVYLSSCWT